VVGTANIPDAEGHFPPDRAAGLVAPVAAHRPALPARMEATGTGLGARAPGAPVRWLAGFAPHPRLPSPGRGGAGG
jgi:hypothetical protein